MVRKSLSVGPHSPILCFKELAVIRQPGSPVIDLGTMLGRSESVVRGEGSRGKWKMRMRQLCGKLKGEILRLGCSRLYGPQNGQGWAE